MSNPNLIKIVKTRRLTKNNSNNIIFKTNKFVYSCGKETITSGCKYCGNCLREYFLTKEKSSDYGSVK